MVWTRFTECYRKIKGHWVVVHEHGSVPADFETGKAVLDLTPE
jgi:ketosteroid isomerase-like protein